MKARNTYKSASQLRHERQTAMGYALITACAFGFAGMAYLFAMIDAANGISVCQSLAAWGL